MYDCIKTNTYKSEAPALFTPALVASFSTTDKKDIIRDVTINNNPNIIINKKRFQHQHQVNCFISWSCSILTLKPPDLGGGPVAFLVAGGNAEDDGRLGGVINVGVGEAGGLDQAGWVGSTIDPHEGQLGRTCTGRGGGLAGLDGQVHGVLCDFP